MNGELYVGGGSTIYKVVDQSLATPSFEDNVILLYPNPAKTEVTFSSKKAIIFDAYSIIDLTGKIVLSNTINASEKQIDISSLPTGLYVLKVSDNSGKSFQTKLSVE